METTSILLIAGFVLCFILLFVFIAKYHGALEDEADFPKAVGGRDGIYLHADGGVRLR